MKSVGIICEYNPFHNGHLYHLQKVKELYKDYIIILIMSGNFTERGDVSIINKWDKTDIALTYGIDLVIELPYVFATESADKFAKASIEMLNYLKVEAIVFGSESNDIAKLSKLADIQLNNKKYNSLIKEYLNSGYNYPTALSKALEQISGKKVTTPNDILAISYIREIKRINSKIKPIAIKRNNDYNSLDLLDNITSASSIRNELKNNGDVSKYVPSLTNDYLKKNIHINEKYFKLLKYKIISTHNLAKFQTVDEGIENRIKKYIINSKSLDELILKIKTKRYTYNKLSRMFIHILCGFTKEEANRNNDIKYIRILGFNINGKAYLNYIKKEIPIPLISNFSSIKDEMLDIEFRTTCIYASILNEKEAIKLIESEYKDFPIIK